VNLAFYKDLVAQERFKLQFTATLDNAFNYPQFFVTPDSSPWSPADLGRRHSAARLPRSPPVPAGLRRAGLAGRGWLSPAHHTSAL
jgi:hypothetical protein